MEQDEVRYSETNVPNFQKHERPKGRYQLYKASSPFFYCSLEFEGFRENSILKLKNKLNKRLQNETLMPQNMTHTQLPNVITKGKFIWFINKNTVQDNVNSFLQNESSTSPAVFKILTRVNNGLLDISPNFTKKLYNHVFGVLTMGRFNLALKENMEGKGDFEKMPYLEGLSLALFLLKPAYSFKMETDVKFREMNTLCDSEKEFIIKRRKIVFDNMKDRCVPENPLQTQEDTPTIAIIGSGGGLRAVMGMCGAITALKYTGILDSAMYTAGVSGSSWYLTAMFANDKQDTPEEMNKIIRQKLQSFSRIRYLGILLGWMNMSRIAEFLKVRNFFSISDSFGEMISGMLIEEEHRGHTWSEQTTKLEHGKVALPIVSALHVRDKKTIKDYHEWIEFSPYEVFIPKYGTGIDMKDLGNEFFGGYITEHYGETSISCLQGICGSAFAKARNFKPSDKAWYMTFSGVKDKIGYLFNAFDSIFVGKVSNWLRGIDLEPLFDDIKDTDKTSDIKDIEDEKMMLVDAGIAFNSPYPPVLHPSRKVDIIISFDFSQRDDDTKCPFRGLEKAEKWANERCVPFPKLNPTLTEFKNEWENKMFKEVYVFQGENTPIIVHFVLINKLCFSPGNGNDNSVFKIFPSYRTKRFTYSEKEVDRLMLLVQRNVLRNIGKIYECINEVVNKKILDRTGDEEHNKSN